MRAEQAAIGETYWLAHGGRVAVCRGVSPVTFSDGKGQAGRYIELIDESTGETILAHPTVNVLDLTAAFSAP